VAKFRLYLEQGIAPPKAPHLYTKARDVKPGELGSTAVANGVRLLQAHVDENSKSPLTAVGMAHTQLMQARGGNLRIAAIQSGMKDLRRESRTGSVMLLVNARYEPIRSAGKVLREETCFTTLGVGLHVMRWKEIMLYLPGKEPRRVTGVEAWIIQHELGDHWMGSTCAIRAHNQGRKLYYVPPEWHNTFFRGGFELGWPEYSWEQYVATMNGRFDLTNYLKFL
jgi:peptide deformylase